MSSVKEQNEARGGGRGQSGCNFLSQRVLLQEGCSRLQDFLCGRDKHGIGNGNNKMKYVLHVIMQTM